MRLTAIQAPAVVRVRTMIQRFPLSFFLTLSAVSCSSPDQSLFIYRIPFEDNTEVDIWQDHLTHNPVNRIDMAGINGTAPYRIVAARAGTVRFIEDGNSLQCCGGTCDNNYIWIQHFGEEWTKYSHFAMGTVTGSGGAGLAQGVSVAAGQYLGDESNVGRACPQGGGIHLHFEVLVPDDQDNPTFTSVSRGALAGENRIPRFCGVPGQVAVDDEEYTATPCPD